MKSVSSLYIQQTYALCIGMKEKILCIAKYIYKKKDKGYSTEIARKDLNINVYIIAPKTEHLRWSSFLNNVISKHMRVEAEKTSVQDLDCDTRYFQLLSCIRYF